MHFSPSPPEASIWPDLENFTTFTALSCLARLARKVTPYFCSGLISQILKIPKMSTISKKKTRSISVQIEYFYEIIKQFHTLTFPSIPAVASLVGWSFNCG